MADGNLDLWLGITSQRYRTASRIASSSQQLADVRRGLQREVDAQRARFRSRAGRLWAAQKIDAAMSGVIGDAILDGRDDPAYSFEAVESLKARMLLDQIAGLEVLPSMGLSAELAELERRVLRFAPSEAEDLAGVELRLLSLLSVGLRWDMGDRLQRLDSTEERYAAHNVGFNGVGVVPSLAEVQNALAGDEALVEYFIPTHPTHPAKEVLAICVTVNEIEVIPLSLESLADPGVIGTIAVDGRQPRDFSPLGQAVWSARLAIQDGDDERADDWLQQLWRILIYPLLNDWHYPDEFKRWIIVPHGPLHYVPFAALKEPAEDGARLIQDVAVTVCPSAATWLALRRRERPLAGTFLGVADPLLRATTLPPLKDALKELSNAIKSLSGLVPTPLLADRATESLVRQEIPGKSVVHFGAHGEFPEDDPFDFHRILLAASEEHDGALHAEELRRMDLRAARLVVLSICDGGLYRFGPGDEPLGLVPALFIAGAENVLAPLWRIEDRAARRLTSAFYKGLPKYGPAEALRRACVAAIKKGTQLRDWAAFVNSGPGLPFDMAGSRKAAQQKRRTSRLQPT